MKFTVKRYGDVWKITYLRNLGGCPQSDEEDTQLAFKDGAGEDDAYKLACNLARARARIREYALCNPWEYFVTLTLNSDKQCRYDLAEYIHDLGIWIGNYNKRYGVKLKYLLIPEQHKDGAWHMHGFFHGVAADSLVKNEHGYLDLPYYAKRFGYISLSPIKDKNKCSSYITKYVTKDVGKAIVLSKHVFYHSRGLAEAEVWHEGECWDMPDGTWCNDFVGIEWCNSGEELTKALSRLEIIS